jgi:hypothetical protein
MLDPVRLADHVEPHRPRDDGVPVSRLFGEPDAVVGRDRVDTVGDGVEEKLQELPCRLPVRLLDQLRNGELARSVNGHEERELAFDCPQLGDVPYRQICYANRLPGSGCGRSRSGSA